jgi:hypothetical protein
VVVINNGAAPVDLEVPAGPAGLVDGSILEDRLHAAAPARVSAGRLHLSLPPRAAAVYAPK